MRLTYTIKEKFCVKRDVVLGAVCLLLMHLKRGGETRPNAQAEHATGQDGGRDHLLPRPANS